MQAVCLNESTVSFERNYSSQPQPGCVPIDVLLAGICETDLQLIQGYMNFSGVLGHEFVGIAREGRYAGQRVVGEINCSCHECETCRQGLPNHCPNRTVIGILSHDGAFAETVWVPERNLHLVPESIPNEQAVFVEPLAAAWQIPAQLELSNFEEIIVLGDGRLGNLCAQVLHSLGHDFLVVGKHAEKLAILQQRGIHTQLLPEISQTRIADLVVDCTGSPSGLRTAFHVVKPRGTVVLKSTYSGDTSPNLANVVIDELTIVGSRCGPFPEAINSLAKGEIDVTSLITSRFPLEDSIQALETAQQKNQLKVLLEVSR